MYCADCHEYTDLGAFVEKEGHFEGEYSLLHNRRANHNEWLCRFLIRHAGHTLRMTENRTEAYAELLRSAARFLESDIDEMVEMQLERRRLRDHELAAERGLGQLQLHVLRSLIAQEAEAIAREPTDNAAKGQFLLGKEEGLKQALRLLDDLLAKTNLLYK